MKKKDSTSAKSAESRMRDGPPSDSRSQPASERHPTRERILNSAKEILIEYGYGGIEVDDATWQPETHHATSFWGHQQVSG